LSDVQNNGNPKLPSCKQVLVLGDNECGKTTIVAKLQGVEDPKKGSGLEYAYIDVRDDYRDGLYNFIIHQK
jgi:dynein light intermediate chain 1